MSQPRASIVILGGGPGGYEAALVAAQLGARVTVVDSDGLGGACVLTDCVPSKTLIALVQHHVRGPGRGRPGHPDRPAARPRRAGPAAGGWAGRAGGRPGRPARWRPWTPPGCTRRIKALARAQSADVALRLAAEGVEIITGRGRLAGPGTVVAGDQRDRGGRGAHRHRRAAPGAARLRAGR